MNHYKRPIKAVWYGLVGLITVGMATTHLSASPSLLTPVSDDFLPPEKAFVLTEDHAADRVTLMWQIAPDYSLYKNKITITSQTAEVDVTPPLYQTPSVMHDDPEFGVVPVFQNIAVADVRIQTSNPAIKSAQLKVTYQGCANRGLCYPPITKIMRVPVMIITKSPAAIPVPTAFAKQEPMDDFQMDKITEHPSPQRLLERTNAANELASDAERIMTADSPVTQKAKHNSMGGIATQLQPWLAAHLLLTIVLSLLLSIAAVFCKAFDTVQTMKQRVQKGFGLLLFCSAIILLMTGLSG